MGTLTIVGWRQDGRVARTSTVLRSTSTMGSVPPEPKACLSCGRRIEWRKKWERDWDQVRYCSTGCRQHGVSDVDRQLEAMIRRLLSQRAATATICPSEAARAVHAARTGAAPGPPARAGSRAGVAAPEVTADGWRELMEPARRAARRLVAAGEVDITQQGHVVDPSTAKGPIRIRRHRG